MRRVATERSTGILLVEQHVRQALHVADRVYVMQRGRIVMSGTGDEVHGRIDEIEATYLSGPRVDVGENERKEEPWQQTATQPTGDESSS